MRGCIVKKMSRPRGGPAPKPRYYVKITTTGGVRWLTDPATGAAFTRKRDAQTHLDQLLHEARTGRLVQPSNVTVAGHTDQWLTLARGRLKPSSWHAYHHRLHTHVLPDLGDVPLQQLTGAHLDQLYLRLLDRLSPATVHQVHVVTKAMLADAHRKALITGNPAVDATPPVPGSGRAGHTTWTAGELAAFLSDTRHTPDGPLWALLALTGCRRGEALALRWADLHPDLARLTITGTLGAVAGRRTTGTPKTGRGRTIALDAGLLEQLHAHRAAQTRRRIAAATWTDRDLMFTGPAGGPLHPDTVTRRFTRAAAATGLPPIRLHDLRHTWATLALQAGINPKIVQERLGHSSITITLSTYSHVLPALHDQAAATIADLVQDNQPRKVLVIAARSGRRASD